MCWRLDFCCQLFFFCTGIECVISVFNGVLRNHFLVYFPALCFSRSPAEILVVDHNGSVTPWTQEGPRADTDPPYGSVMLLGVLKSCRESRACYYSHTRMISLNHRKTQMASVQCNYFGLRVHLGDSGVMVSHSVEMATSFSAAPGLRGFSGTGTTSYGQGDEPGDSDVTEAPGAQRRLLEFC